MMSFPALSFFCANSRWVVNIFVGIIKRKESYTVAWRYEFYFLSLVAFVRKMILPCEHKIHISMLPSVLCCLYTMSFDHIYSLPPGTSLLCATWQNHILSVMTWFLVTVEPVLSDHPLLSSQLSKSRKLWPLIIVILTSIKRSWSPITKS